MEAGSNSLPDVSLDLRYKGTHIATYGFDELADANAFLIGVKSLADADPSVVVRCSVSIEASSNDLTDPRGIPLGSVSTALPRKTNP